MGGHYRRHLSGWHCGDFFGGGNCVHAAAMSGHCACGSDLVPQSCYCLLVPRQQSGHGFLTMRLAAVMMCDELDVEAQCSADDEFVVHDDVESYIGDNGYDTGLDSAYGGCCPCSEHLRYVPDQSDGIRMMHAADLAVGRGHHHVHTPCLDHRGRGGSIDLSHMLVLVDASADSGPDGTGLAMTGFSVVDEIGPFSLAPSQPNERRMVLQGHPFGACCHFVYAYDRRFCSPSWMWNGVEEAAAAGDDGGAGSWWLRPC